MSSLLIESVWCIELGVPSSLSKYQLIPENGDRLYERLVHPRRGFLFEHAELTLRS